MLTWAFLVPEAGLATQYGCYHGRHGEVAEWTKAAPC